MREFFTGTLLSVTTGRLYTRPNESGNGIEDLYDLLEYMCGEAPFTHQLPRFTDYCRDSIKRQCPDLEIVHPDNMAVVKQVQKDGIDVVLRRLGLKVSYSIIPMSTAITHINPISELLSMKGAK